MRAILFVSFNAVLGVVPDKSLLDHVSAITGDKTGEQGTSDPPSVLSIGAGLSYQTKMRSSLSRPKGAKSRTSQNGCNATAFM